MLMSYCTGSITILKGLFFSKENVCTRIKCKVMYVFSRRTVHVKMHCNCFKAQAAIFDLLE